MSLNQSMNISLGSMKNNQYALTVVSQNIANLHVDGYHRQRVNFVTNEYTTNCENVISTIKGMNGASISSLSDYIDDAAFKDLLDSNADSNYYNTLADALGELEGIADDLGDNGLNGLLNEFYAAAADLEKFPTDMSIRQQYVLAAQNVCEKFNQVSTKCESLQEDKFQAVSNEVVFINNLMTNLAKANEAHVKNNQGSSTQVEINNILKELSNYMDVKTEANANGTVNVFLGDVALVQGGELKYNIEVDFDSTNPDGAVKFSLKSTENPDYIIENGVADKFNSGSMRAYVEFLNGSSENYTSINDIKTAMDTAALTFANALNDIQTFGSYDEGVFAAALGADADGNTILIESNTPMFTTSDGAEFSASNIQVNSAILNDPFLVAAARIDLANYTDENGNVDANWVKSIGNSDNATKITALQNEKICIYNNGKNKCTLSEFLTNNAAKTGMDVATIQAKADTANDIADADATNYANIVGVNLDEELADMIKYQRAYEASAKLFSTINDLMGTIISMV
ncbi:MAG: flagellar hook-associated protein FlgK [Candidatus Gastranaerophilales bacterium]|nr:flagellar hook-associated protein FlgK [Candidatus Gastranaerophilales bacterium]